jgi:NTP pyrophosphatase (non-canonical NTP hydrolase)
MLNLKKLQKEIYQNKLDKKFNVTDINLEFCYIYAELAEAFEAHKKGLPKLGEELADVCIYLLGLAEILKIDLGKEIVKKIEVNKNRQFKLIDGKWIRIDEDGKKKVVATEKWVKKNVK